MRFVVYTITNAGNMAEADFLKICDFDEQDEAACAEVETFINSVVATQSHNRTMTAATLDAENALLDFDVFKNIMGDWVSESFSRMTRDHHELLRAVRQEVIRMQWDASPLKQQ